MSRPAASACSVFGDPFQGRDQVGDLDDVLGRLPRRDRARVIHVGVCASCGWGRGRPPAGTPPPPDSEPASSPPASSAPSAVPGCPQKGYRWPAPTRASSKLESRSVPVTSIAAAGSSSSCARCAPTISIPAVVRSGSACPRARLHGTVAAQVEADSTPFITHPVGHNWRLAPLVCPRHAASEATVPRRRPSVLHPTFQFCRSPRAGRELYRQFRQWADQW